MSTQPTNTPLSKLVKEAAEQLRANGEAINKATQPSYPASGTPAQAFGAPHIRQGEDPMSSRPFSFLRLFGATCNGGHRAPLDADKAKLEINCLSEFQDIMREKGWSPKENGTLVPMGTGLLDMDVASDARVKTLRQMVATGAEIDPEEAAWIRRRVYMKNYSAGVVRSPISPAQSWLDATLGGDIVPLPAMGEIIELLRNKEALINAGAKVIPLPPQGSIKFPKIMSPTTGSMQTENTTTSASTLGTGSLILSAKKVVSLVNVPNELFRYATPAAEAILREDIAKTLALNIDLQALEGAGDANTIKGIINYPNIVAHTASKVGAAGNTILPQDGYIMAGKVEENNVDVSTGSCGFIMRPLMWARIVGFRADAVASGDQAGQFVQALMRSLGDGGGRTWCEFPVTKSTQINRSRQKGGATNLTYVLFGQWADYFLGMFGGIEFLSSNLSDNAMQNDLTIVRGILLADGGPRHEGAFALCDNLLYQ